MTVEEFLGLAAEDDRRLELIDGVVVAMAPPSRAHGIVAGNLAVALGLALRGRPPCVVQIEAGVLSATHEETLYQADLVVTCEPHRRGEQVVAEPVLVVEILSPSTESADRKVKLPDYRQMPSVREVLFVDQDRMFCELHRRVDGGRWLTELHLQPDARLRLESLDPPLELSLAELYAGVDLGR